MRIRPPLILLGAPGSGKGTQARVICNTLGVPHIATGEILRQNVKRQTRLGLSAKNYMEKGELVPDDLVNEIMRDRLANPDCVRGFLLDGYPRTVAQAREFQNVLREIGQTSPVVVSLQVGPSVILDRLMGRWTCPACERTYSPKTHPPYHRLVCTIDGTDLEQRADDRDDAIRERIAAWERHRAALMDFYRGAGNVLELNGEQSPEVISRELHQQLSNLQPPQSLTL